MVLMGRYKGNQRLHHNHSAVLTERIWPHMPENTTCSWMHSMHFLDSN